MKYANLLDRLSSGGIIGYACEPGSEVIHRIPVYAWHGQDNILLPELESGRLANGLDPHRVFEIPKKLHSSTIALMKRDVNKWVSSGMQPEAQGVHVFALGVMGIGPDHPLDFNLAIAALPPESAAAVLSAIDAGELEYYEHAGLALWVRWTDLPQAQARPGSALAGIELPARPTFMVPYLPGRGPAEASPDC